MTSWPSHLRSQWFAVTLSRKVGRAPKRFLLLGRPIVLARLDGQRVVGFEDRCPHRHAPLSKGRCIDGQLQCPYHGWRFDAQGRLQALPGAPPGQRLPGIHARRVRVTERDGVIWIRECDDDEHDLPERVRSMDTWNRKFLWQTVWRGNIVDALENVLDPLHTHFVHPGLVRKGGERCAMRVRLQPNNEGFTVDYSGHETQSGLLYRLFESPRESERAHFCAPGTAQLEYRYRNGSRACISLHFSPQDDRNTHLIGMLHVQGRRVPAWAVRLFLWPFIRRVAKQDARMLGWQADNTHLFGDRQDIVTRCDIVRRHLMSAWCDDPASIDLPPDGIDTELYL
ncbi:Rieske 2Fe-2S domain-containing protein [Oleiagrimonas sp. MCCC 1A03011]|uniref:Rieske 2Fe-2S domain-containing protein n=1 Tax=Oleiagrimonas sp. MCCC 1A03011 TaxID=1926883 RepID=UPI000DC55C11|nr:Rieske 2Fe-2S domain-containing protein [Oleiagrimonas sp. MCCC 1A03011]RAP57229.1 hypothetical protein BTJ49_11845 [Oleiagrimonas sp. MCCC 1A03011]